jgi:hypothetical protein
LRRRYVRDSFFTASLAVTSEHKMSREIATISLLVREYDEAIQFFTEALRFKLVEDSHQTPGKRWVVVSPGQGNGVSLLLGWLLCFKISMATNGIYYNDNAHNSQTARGACSSTGEESR